VEVLSLSLKQSRPLRLSWCWALVIRDSAEGVQVSIGFISHLNHRETDTGEERHDWRQCSNQKQLFKFTSAQDLLKHRSEAGSHKSLWVSHYSFWWVSTHTHTHTHSLKSWSGLCKCYTKCFLTETVTSIALEGCESESSELKKTKTKHVITSLLLKENSVTETLLQPLYTHTLRI